MKSFAQRVKVCSLVDQTVDFLNPKETLERESKRSSTNSERHPKARSSSSTHTNWRLASSKF